MTTNNADNEPIIKASDRQLAANRANARKSTGPKSAAGKLTVARNGIEHGIYALCPVIEDVESPREWKRYRDAMLASLSPVGGLESNLAERIILTSWRLRRAARYEAEQIRLTQAAAPEVIGAQLGLERDGAANDLEAILSNSEISQQTWGTLHRFADASDDATFSQDQAEDLLWHVHHRLGLKDAFDDYWQEVPEPDVWTAGLIRQLARAVAEQHGQNFEQLLPAMKDKATSELVQYGRAASQVKRGLDQYRREHLLPDNETLEKVMRYEAHLSRLFHRDLHELQRLQALRHGQSVAAPIAIDVDVTTGPKPPSDGNG